MRCERKKSKNTKSHFQTRPTILGQKCLLSTILNCNVFQLKFEPLGCIVKWNITLGTLHLPDRISLERGQLLCKLNTEWLLLKQTCKKFSQTFAHFFENLLNIDPIDFPLEPVALLAENDVRGVFNQIRVYPGLCHNNDQLIEALLQSSITASRVSIDLDFFSQKRQTMILLYFKFVSLKNELGLYFGDYSVIK